MVTTCQCGKQIYVRKTGECQTCYNSRYYREHYTPPAPPAPRARIGSTIELATECSYVAAHLRVRAQRGPASSHPCAECDSPAVDWSYRGTSPVEQQGWSSVRDRRRSVTRQWVAWSGYIHDYDPLCRSCHTRRDRKQAAA